MSGGRAPLWPLVLVLLLILSACGDDGGDGPDDDQTPDDGAVEVGRVKQVFDILVRVEGRNAAQGDPLLAGAAMQTDGNGRALFTVEDILEDCTIREESEVVVAPSADTPLAVERGRVACLSKPGEGQEFQIDAGGAEVAFLDPIFTVEVDGTATQVQVDYGFVDLRRSGRGSQSRLVGPGAQILLTPEGMPERPERFETSSLDDFDRSFIGDMRNALPAEPTGLPRPGDSRALSSIESADRFDVGIDGRASGRVERFAENLAEAIAERWGVEPELDVMGSDEALESIQEGRIQAFISPEPLTGASSLALFDAEGEEDWIVSVLPDGRFQGALEETLEVSLNNGQYGEAYYDAFGVVPTYEAVRSVVYPSPEQAGRSQWREPQDPARTPAEVSSVDLSVDPIQYSGPCPAELVFTGTVEVEEPGWVDVEFLLDGQGYRSSSIVVDRGLQTLRRTLGVDESGLGVMELVIRANRTLDSEAGFSVVCQPPTPTPPPTPSPSPSPTLQVPF